MTATTVVRRAWEAELGSPIHDDSDFFALGGDSLKALSICSKVEAAFGTRPKVRLLFDHPCFEDYVRELEGQM